MRGPHKSPHTFPFGVFLGTIAKSNRFQRTGDLPALMIATSWAFRVRSRAYGAGLVVLHTGE